MKFFNMIYGNEVHLAPEKKVIPADEFSQLLTAKELLDQVKKEAETYKKEMLIEVEKHKEQGFKEGFIEGLEKWSQQIKLLEEDIKKVNHDVEKIAIPLALKAAKKIVTREIELKPDIILEIVKNQLRVVSEHKKITIFVHQTNLKSLEKNKPALEKLFSRLESLSIQENEDVEPNGCIIETEAGIINAQISQQWKILEQVFENMLQESKSSNDVSESEEIESK